MIVICFVVTLLLPSSFCKSLLPLLMPLNNSQYIDLALLFFNSSPVRMIINVIFFFYLSKCVLYKSILYSYCSTNFCLFVWFFFLFLSCHFTMEIYQYHILLYIQNHMKFLSLFFEKPDGKQLTEYHYNIFSYDLPYFKSFFLSSTTMNGKNYPGD